MVKNLQVGNGELVATLFVIPFIFKVGKHMFEVYTLVSEIQLNIDIILGVKNMFEIEGEISCCTSQFRFLNRSLPIFTLSTHRIKVGVKAYVKAEVPFIEKLSRHVIAKLLYKGSLGTSEDKTGRQPYCHTNHQQYPFHYVLIPRRIDRHNRP